MGNLLLHAILGTPLAAIILAPIVTYLGDKGQEVVTFYDKLPPIGKQGAAVLLSFVLVLLANWIPGVVPDACGNVAATGIGSDCINGLLAPAFLTTVITTALGAIAIKHGQQNKAAGK